MNPSKDFKVTRVQNAAAAGTTNLDGTTLDMQGYDGVMFIYGVGTLTATQATKLKAGGGAASNGSDKADLAGTGTPQGANFADGDGTKLAVLEVFRPVHRYVTPTLVRGTANAVVDFGIAIQFKGSKTPVVNGSTVVATVLAVSPAAGTAG